MRPHGGAGFSLPGGAGFSLPIRAQLGLAFRLPTLWRWAALAAALVLLRSVTLPDLPLCGFRWLTGRPCPLCGLTRAVVALANGRWAEAVHWHALSPLAVVMLAALVWNPPRLARLWMPCFAAFGVYGVWRMVF